MDVKPGAFFLTQIGGPVGFAIGVGQALAGAPSRYSHAGIVLDTDGTVLEAEPGGARIANLSEYAGRPLLMSDGPVRTWLAERPASPPKMAAVIGDYPEHWIRANVVAEARKLIGVPYSGADYAALALLHLHLPSLWIRQRVESSGHLICSALVDRAYLNAGIHLFDDKPYKLAPNRPRYVGDVMPSDLASWAEDHAMEVTR